ncbi:hypothetical protein V8E55_008260 [Tylopilus felleus]
MSRRWLWTIATTLCRDGLPAVSSCDLRAKVAIVLCHLTWTVFDSVGKDSLRARSHSQVYQVAFYLTSWPTHCFDQFKQYPRYCFVESLSLLRPDSVDYRRSAPSRYTSYRTIGTSTISLATTHETSSEAGIDLCTSWDCKPTSLPTSRAWALSNAGFVGPVPIANLADKSMDDRSITNTKVGATLEGYILLPVSYLHDM